MTDHREDDSYLGPRRRRSDFVEGSSTFLRKTKTVLGIKVERTLGEIIAVAIVLALIGWFGFGQLEAVKDQQIADVEYTSLLATYQSDLRVYDAAVAAQALCVDSVGRSDANRDQWALLADIVAALDSGSGRAVGLANEIRTGPVLSTERRSIDDCPDVPPVPEPPSR